MPAIDPDTYMGKFKFADSSSDPAYVIGAAGESHIGAVGGNSAYPTVALTTSGSGLYATGQYIGVSGAASEITGAARTAGGTGILYSGVLTDAGNQSASLEVWITDTAVVPPANKAAFGLSDSDLAHVLAVVPFSTYYSSGSGSVSLAASIGTGIKCAAGSTSLYQCVVSRGAGNYEANDLKFKWFFVQD